MNEPEVTKNDELEPKESSPSSYSWKSLLKEILIFAAVAGGIVLPFRMFIAEPYIVSGASMDPTFTTGDYLIVDKLSYEIGEPKRNSVIVFKFPLPIPGESGKNLIKRVIGLPGDTVDIRNGIVTITYSDTNSTSTTTSKSKSFVLDQSYLTHTTQDNYSVTLGKDEYFVMGDNRPASYDSRSWGILPKKYILGRPIVRLLPVNEIGLLPGDHTEKQEK